MKKSWKDTSLDAVINQLANVTGASRKQVIDALKKMQSIPEVRKELERRKK